MDSGVVMSLVGDYASDEETNVSSRKRTLPEDTPQVPTKKAKTSSTPISPKIQTKTVEKKSFGDLTLPSFFDEGEQVSEGSGENLVLPSYGVTKVEKVTKKSGIPSNKKLVPPQLRSARPNLVTEDYEAWNLKKEKVDRKMQQEISTIENVDPNLDLQ